ncbi:hypothetical protein HII31_13027 [Pseudocercospora fuligena]|uniref:Uncharacterized protein n=1 Tax=Pseudocercospora fuligena TaxID=685502 RepID=A0A8H6R887_9PEZI|nr:hypothetical protein HII31_13027 [Pseudocercospora fuligena]
MGSHQSKTCVTGDIATLERDTAAALAEVARLNTKIDAILAITLVIFLVLCFTSHAQRVAMFVSIGASAMTFITATIAQTLAVVQMGAASAVTIAIDVRYHFQAGFVEVRTAVKDAAFQAAMASGLSAAYLRIFGDDVVLQKNLGGRHSKGNSGEGSALSKIVEDKSAYKSAKRDGYVFL